MNISAKLHHPCVIKFIGYSDVDFKKKKKPVIVVEYLPNGSLNNLLEGERNGKPQEGWDATKKLIIIYGIAAGMSYLHSNDIIHRDLKPDNIMLDDHLFPKIADFGVSKRFGESPDSTVGRFKGSIAYASPEIFTDDLYSKAGDVYAFSMIVYEIMTGQISYKKFEKLSKFQVQQLIVNGTRPELNDDIPHAYQKLMEDCWQNSSTNRPTFEEILDRLTNIDEGFITDDVNQEDFFSYVEYIKKSRIAFDSEKQIIPISEFFDTSKPIFKPVVVPKITLYPIEGYKKLDEFHQKLVLDAENNKEIQFQVGQQLFEGINGFTKNTILGSKYLKASLKNGNADACLYLSKRLIEGEGVFKSIEKADKYLTLFVESNDSRIFTLLADVKRQKEDYEAAASCMKKAADSGSADAMYEYGAMLYSGKGVTKNEKEAKAYFRKAKRNGYEGDFPCSDFEEDSSDDEACSAEKADDDVIISEKVEDEDGLKPSCLDGGDVKKGGRRKFLQRKDSSESIMQVKIKVPKIRKHSKIRKKSDVDDVNQRASKSDDESIEAVEQARRDMPEPARALDEDVEKVEPPSEGKEAADSDESSEEKKETVIPSEDDDEEKKETVMPIKDDDEDKKEKKSVLERKDSSSSIKSIQIKVPRIRSKLFKRKPT